MIQTIQNYIIFNYLDASVNNVTVTLNPLAAAAVRNNGPSPLLSRARSQEKMTAAEDNTLSAFAGSPRGGLGQLEKLSFATYENMYTAY